MQEEFYGRSLISADRELCESSIDEILKEAKTQEIALLVVGDPLGATTHTDMLLRAKDFGVETQVPIKINRNHSVFAYLT